MALLNTGLEFIFASWEQRSTAFQSARNLRADRRGPQCGWPAGRISSLRADDHLAAFWPIALARFRLGEGV